MATDLYLIRHGESRANVEPIVGGMRGDAGLTDRGRRQGELLEQRLRAAPIAADWLYASTLPRAQQTAGYVARALGLDVHDDDGIEELRPGDADGLSIEEWQRRYPGLEGGFLVSPFQPFAPGGESWADFLARSGAALTGLVLRHAGESVAAVTHGGVIESSFYLAFGIGPTINRASIAAHNTGITHWRHRLDDAGRSEWTLVSFNDTHHLDDEVHAESPKQAVPTPPEG